MSKASNKHDRNFIYFQSVIQIEKKLLPCILGEEHPHNVEKDHTLSSGAEEAKDEVDGIGRSDG